MSSKVRAWRQVGRPRLRIQAAGPEVLHSRPMGCDRPVGFPNFGWFGTANGLLELFSWWMFWHRPQWVSHPLLWDLRSDCNDCVRNILSRGTAARQTGIGDTCIRGGDEGSFHPISTAKLAASWRLVAQYERPGILCAIPIQYRTITKLCDWRGPTRGWHGSLIQSLIQTKSILISI